MYRPGIRDPDSKATLDPWEVICETQLHWLFIYIQAQVCGFDHRKVLNMSTCEPYQDYHIPSEGLAILKNVFPEEIASLKRRVKTHLNNESDTDEYTQLMQLTIASHYIARDGPDWAEKKREELTLEGLTFVGYYDDSNQLKAFITILLTTDDWGLVLYLYEIHVHPDYHSRHIGSQLITSFHKLAVLLQQCGTMLDSNTCASHLNSTKLTVFSDNDRAVQWYTKLGYLLSDESPQNKVLRSGRVIKPAYYILYRPLGL